MRGNSDPAGFEMEGSFELWVMCGSFVLLWCWACRWPLPSARPVATVLAADLPVAVVFQKMVGGMNPFSFLAIPSSSSRGEIMMPHGGIADRIVTFAKSMVGHVRGGLA